VGCDKDHKVQVTSGLICNVWLVSGFAGVGIVMIEECVEIVINVSTVNQ